MQYKEEILMDEAYKAHLRKTFIKPLIRQTLLLTVAAVLLLLFFIDTPLENSVKYSSGRRWGGKIPNSEFTMSIEDRTFSNVVSAFILLLVVYAFFKTSKKSKYFKDYRFGYIIRERVTVTKVFETPAGINVYWLSGDAISNFAQEKCNNLKLGCEIDIYYLKYLKELLEFKVVN